MVSGGNARFTFALLFRFIGHHFMAERQSGQLASEVSLGGSLQTEPWGCFPCQHVSVCVCVCLLFVFFFLLFFHVIVSGMDVVSCVKRLPSAHNFCARKRAVRLRFRCSKLFYSTGSPVVLFCPFLGEGSPTKIDYRKNGYPDSLLSTGGPSSGRDCHGPHL